MDLTTTPVRINPTASGATFTVVVSGATVSYGSTPACSDGTIAAGIYQTFGADTYFLSASNSTLTITQNAAGLTPDPRGVIVPSTTFPALLDDVMLTASRLYVARGYTRSRLDIASVKFSYNAGTNDATSTLILDDGDVVIGRGVNGIGGLDAGASTLATPVIIPPNSAYSVCFVTHAGDAVLNCAVWPSAAEGDLLKTPTLRYKDAVSAAAPPALGATVSSLGLAAAVPYLGLVSA